jgi:23S rRNA (uracil1939-C5)-methyltransferase
MAQAGPERRSSVIEVEILRLAAGGDGVGKLPDGRTVFVPRTAPGDLVEITGLREHKRFARARLAGLQQASAHRVEPRCPHYVHDDCGGCQLQHLDNEAQLAARQSFVGDALTLHADPGGRRIGLHRYDRAGQIFDLEWCHITVPALMDLWQAVRALRRLLPPHLEQVVLRLDRAGGRHLVIRVGEGEVWSGAERLWREMEHRGAHATLWYQPHDGVARAVAGAGEAFPATVFEQVHPDMGDRVRDFAVLQLGDVAGRKVWDLYAGIGETTRQLMARGALVESVELDRQAVAEAERRGPAARRHSGRVEDLLTELKQPELVITNPPRTGMHERVTSGLERARPTRLVYISCDPATLARDLQRLVSFRLVLVQAFDLFPQTTHVETVAVMEPA